MRGYHDDLPPPPTSSKIIIFRVFYDMTGIVSWADHLKAWAPIALNSYTSTYKSKEVLLVKGWVKEGDLVS